MEVKQKTSEEELKEILDDGDIEFFFEFCTPNIENKLLESSAEPPIFLSTSKTSGTRSNKRWYRYGNALRPEDLTTIVR